MSGLSQSFPSEANEGGRKTAKDERKTRGVFCSSFARLSPRLSLVFRPPPGLVPPEKLFSFDSAERAFEFGERVRSPRRSNRNSAELGEMYKRFGSFRFDRSVRSVSLRFHFS